MSGRATRRWRAAMAALVVWAGAWQAGAQTAEDEPNERPQLTEADVQEDLRYARSLSRAFQRVAQQVEPSVVHITTIEKIELVRRDIFGRRWVDERENSGLGSGVIVSAEGHILTNDHVAGRADRLVVRLYDGREFAAELLGRDPATDLAVLKIQAPDLAPAAFADSDAAQVGEWVLAIGSPFGFEQSVTAGIISAKGRSGLYRGGRVEAGDRYEEFIQTDAAINPGNSGGPLVDLEGRIVGINTQILTVNGVGGRGGNIGLGFAIPSNMARSVYEMILRYGRTERGWLGVDMEDLSPQLAEQLGVPGIEGGGGGGVLISQVIPGGPAEKAGLRQGDVVIAIDGRGSGSVNRLRNAIAFTEPGATIEIVYVRDRERRTARVELMDQMTGRAMALGGTVMREFGIITRPLREAEASSIRAAHGMVVLDVINPSRAQEAGLQRLDVILSVDGAPARSVEDLKRFFTGEQGSRERTLLLYRGGMRGTLTVK